MILIYAFSNQWGTNISHRTLLELQKLLKNNISPLDQGEMSQSDKGVLTSKSSQGEIEVLSPPFSREGRVGFDFKLIYFHPRQFFQKYIAHNDYDLIIGLGDTYGDFSKIRIETQAKNAYNNQPIYPFSPILIDLSIPLLENYDSNNFAISSNMGTYNCNWLAYSIQLHIDQKHLSTKQIFLHLPKKSNALFLANQIKNLFDLNNII